MSYRHATNQIADRSQLLVTLDLVSRGFVPSVPVSRDTVYDLIVEREQTQFETVQVKTLNKHILRLTNRAHGDEPVSRNGKARNKYHYAHHGISWVVGVQHRPHVEFFYYPLEVYRHYEKIDVRKVPPVDFGIRLLTVAPAIFTPNQLAAPSFDDLES